MTTLNRQKPHETYNVTQLHTQNKHIRFWQQAISRIEGDQKNYESEIMLW